MNLSQRMLRSTSVSKPAAVVLTLVGFLATGEFVCGQAPYPLSSPDPLAQPRFEQPPPTPEPPAGSVVAEVKIVGNTTISQDRIISHLRTRRDREFNAETVQEDKRRLIRTGLFREVRVYRQEASQGIVVTFEVMERPTIQYVRFHGARRQRDKTLLRETGLEVGESLDRYSVEEGRRKLEEFYRSKGFPKAAVQIMQGNEPGDRGVIYSISEGPLQRIEKVEFIGNTVATDQRLKTQIQSKPGYLWYFLRGKVDFDKVDQDTETLTKYYRGLGYFGARIGRQLEYEGPDQEWLTLRFVIDEGPRYVVNNVSIIGNELFDTDSLLGMLSLKQGEFFNLDKMNRDEASLRDLYGGNGHIFANVDAGLRFLPDGAGRLDLVYEVEEGEQFRVGRLNVHIAGENPHTRESVVRNRLSLRTGDIVDIREVRASERRLQFSQLFEHDPANGKSPRIEYRLPQLKDADKFPGRTARGQSPSNR